MRKILNELIIKYGNAELFITLDGNMLKKLYCLNEEEALEKIEELKLLEEENKKNKKMICEPETIYYF